MDDFFLDNTEDMRKSPEIRDDPDYIHRVNPAYTVLDLGLDLEIPGIVRLARLEDVVRTHPGLRIRGEKGGLRQCPIRLKSGTSHLKTFIVLVLSWSSTGNT